MIICKICGRNCVNSNSFGRHVKIHKLTHQEYFDKYIEPNIDHKCPYCNNKRKFHGRYYKTCGSSSCTYKAKKDSMFKNFGCINIFQLPEVKDKCRNTMIEKYGIISTMQLPEVREKQRNTLIKRYGEDNPSKIKEFRDKRQNTLLSKYGVYCSWELIKNKTSSDFEITAGNEIVSEFNLVKFERNNRSILTIEQLNSYCNSQNIENNFDWKSNHELDLYLPDYKLAIEFNGIYFHNNDSVIIKDLLKKDLCDFLGIKLLIIPDFGYEFNNEYLPGWYEDKNYWLDKICTYLNKCEATNVYIK